MNLAVEVKNLTKIYQQEICALNNINLSIPQGSLFGLLGPNGAGKSTLINILGSIVNKTSGKVSVMGFDIDKNSKIVKSLIGVVLQEIALDTFFSIKKYLEFYSGYYGIKPQQEKINEIIENLGLSDKTSATARQLSGGMKRRLMIAKALVHSPKVLILDEPTAGVDIALREQLWRYIRKLNKMGITIILTTHYLHEAEELCDHIAFIDKSRILKVDSKHNIMNNLGYRKIILTLSDAIDTTPDHLAGYSIQKISPCKLEITTCKRADINEVLHSVYTAKLSIKSLEIFDEDLNTVFKKIIG